MQISELRLYPTEKRQQEPGRLLSDVQSNIDRYRRIAAVRGKRRSRSKFAALRAWRSRHRPSSGDLRLQIKHESVRLPAWVSPSRAEPTSCAAGSGGTCQYVIDANSEDPPTDAEFLNRAQDGDHAAFSQLVERYRPILIRYCQCYLKDHHRAEDAAQVAFTRAWVNIGDCHGEFRPWLLKIAKNYGLDELKKPEHRRMVRFPQEGDVAEIASPQEPLDEVMARRLDLIAAITCLPPPYRAVVELRIAGEPFPALAQRLGIRPTAARKRFERAIKALRIMLALGDGAYADDRNAKVA